ncbi:MAG: hypothetical protein ACJ8FS_00695 [Sphingomicrobium sp.]
MTIDPQLGPVFKRISTPEAHYLAELAIIQSDLKAAQACFQLYFDKYWDQTMTGENLVISGALFRDGIILYCSCFSKPNPKKPAAKSAKLDPDEVYSVLDDGWQDAYQGFLDVRDTFIAHNFGPLRQHNVGIQCREEGGQLRASKIMGSYATFGGWNANEAPAVLSFVGIALHHNNKRIEAAEKVVWEQALKLTPERLAALPDLNLSLPNREDWRGTRDKFRQNEQGRRTINPKGRSGRITGQT